MYWQCRWLQQRYLVQQYGLNNRHDRFTDKRKAETEDNRKRTYSHILWPPPTHIVLYKYSEKNYAFVLFVHCFSTKQIYCEA